MGGSEARGGVRIHLGHPSGRLAATVAPTNTVLLSQSLLYFFLSDSYHSTGQQVRMEYMERTIFGKAPYPSRGFHACVESYVTLLVPKSSD